MYKSDTHNVQRASETNSVTTVYIHYTVRYLNSFSSFSY